MKNNILKPGDNLWLAILSWIHILLLFGCPYLLLAALSQMSPAEAGNYLLYVIWLIIPSVCSWIFIRKIRMLWAYLLCSILICAVIGALTDSILTTLLSAAIFLIRCYTRIKKGQLQRALRDMPGDAGAQLTKELWEIPTFLDQPRPVYWIVFCICYAGILFTEQYYLLRWIFFLLLAEIFICFISCYFRSMWNFIRDNQKIANLPSRTIQKVGKILLIIAVTFLLLAVFPSILYNREPLIDLLQNRAQTEMVPSTEWLEFLESGMDNNMDWGDLMEEPAEPPLWLTILSDVLMYLSVTAVIVLLLFAIYRLCRNAAHYFSQDEEDEIIFLGMEEQESLRHSRKSHKKTKEKWYSPNRKIRRYYRKTLRNALNERPAGWETPQELERKAQLAAGEQTELLHRLYEKARYSREGCSRKDVEKILE